MKRGYFQAAKSGKLHKTYSGRGFDDREKSWLDCTGARTGKGKLMEHLPSGSGQMNLCKRCFKTR